MRRRNDIPEPEETLTGLERTTDDENAAQEKSIAEEKQVRDAFLMMLIGDPVFRKWLMEILTEFQTFSNPFGFGPTGHPDPMGTQFALGMKAAGWRLWEIFDNLAPELASKMRRGE